jgi:hypothetical protein
MLHRAAMLAGLVELSALAVTRSSSADSPAPPGVEPADEGVMLGASVAWLAPGFPHTSGGDWSDTPSYSAGPAVGVTAGYRWDWFVLGASYQHGFLGGGTWSVMTTTVQTLSARSDYGALDLIAMTAPRALVAAYFHVAAGARVMRYTTSDGYDPTSSGGYVAPDVLLGIGAQVHVLCLRVVPEADVGLGPIGLYSQVGASVFFDVGSVH